MIALVFGLFALCIVITALLIMVPVAKLIEGLSRLMIQATSLKASVQRGQIWLRPQMSIWFLVGISIFSAAIWLLAFHELLIHVWFSFRVLSNIVALGILLGLLYISIRLIMKKRYLIRFREINITPIVNLYSRSILRNPETEWAIQWMTALSINGIPSEMGYALSLISKASLPHFMPIYVQASTGNNDATKSTIYNYLAKNAPHLLTPFKDKLLKEVDPLLRIQSLNILDQLPNVESGQVLTHLLADSSVSIRSQAIAYALKHGVLTLEDWRSMLMDQNYYRQLSAIEAVRKLKYRQALVELRILLSRNEVEIVSAAMAVVAEWKDEKSIPKIADLLLEKSPNKVLVSCLLAFRSLSIDHRVMARILELAYEKKRFGAELANAAERTIIANKKDFKGPVLKILSSKGFTVSSKRHYAAELLAKMADMELLPEYSKMLHHTDQRIILAGIGGLHKLKKKVDIVPAILMLLASDKDTVVGEVLKILLESPDLRMLHSVLTCWERLKKEKKQIESTTHKLEEWEKLHLLIKEVETLIKRLQEENQIFQINKKQCICNRCLTGTDDFWSENYHWVLCRHCHQADELMVRFDHIEGHIGGEIRTDALPDQQIYRIQLWEHGQAKNADITRLVVHPIARVDWAVSAVLAALENDATRKEPLRPTVRLMAGVELQPNTIKLLQDTGWQLET